MNKKICRFLAIGFFFLCIWIGLIYFERPTPRAHSVNVRSNKDSLEDVPLGMQADFAATLSDLRKKVLRVLRNTDFNDSNFENPLALYTKLNSYAIDSLTMSDVLSLGVRGKLNLYRWNDFCSVGTNKFKSIPGFPSNPYTKSTLSTLNTQFVGNNFGQRIFGYLIPPVSGVYSFSVASSSSLELWISLYPNPSHSRLIASVCDAHVNPADCPSLREDNYTAYLSDTMHFSEDKPYYIEILTVYTLNDSRIDVKWRKPGADVYSDIPSKCFVSFTMEQNSVVPESYHPSPPLPIHRLKRPRQPTARDVLFKYPKLPLTEFSSSIPRCHLTDEIKNVHSNKFTVPFPSVYPYDQSGMVKSDDASLGNNILPEKEAKFIVDSFLEQIRLSIPKISLHMLVNIEKYEHRHSVARYLIEVLVHTESNSNELFAISENFFSVSSPSINFCQHKVFKRREPPFVHIVVSVKDNAHWIRDLIENFERVYEETGDERFSIVVVDFQSTDINTEVLLRQSKLRHWMLIEVEGAFLRHGGINLALDEIQNPSDIVFTADLSLGLPLNILDQIRKRTFLGYSAYAPAIIHQMCGHSYTDTVGYWEVMSYSLVGMYKSDWMKVGGMNGVDFQDKLSGEDWRCIDKILENGINLNRIKERNFYHHFHSEVLWD